MIKIRELKECRYCHIKTRSWITHHRDRNKKNNNSDNLEIICRSCHAQEHIEETADNLRHDAYTYIGRKQTVGYRLVAGFSMLQTEYE